MYTRRDQQLLAEAYSAKLLMENINNMTLQQLFVVAENASLSELDIIEEFLSGLKNVVKGASNTMKSAGQAVKAGAERAGQAVKAGGRAVKAGATQVGDNVKQMYQTGEASASANKRVESLKQQIVELQELLQQHIDATPRSSLTGKNIKSLTLQQIEGALNSKSGQAAKAAGAASERGVFGGVGQAAKDAFNKPQ